MGCTSCGNKSDGVPSGCGNNGHCASGTCGRMGVFNWLENMKLPDGQKEFDGVEVRFKNGRKGYFKNSSRLHLYLGDVVVVESAYGYDVGLITLTGELVKTQLSRKNIHFDSHETKKVYRKARPEDMDKWKEARDMEETTMHRARTLALHHNLQMKISDVEYQGDKTKATFFYTADERVDFRELIKTMAEEFKIRIEMRQIGARQEAGRLGGIGSCGRELCCSTWMTDFRTVSTSAARYQQLSLNPQKLAGQCGKLKCCLNYELDMYVEAFKDFPSQSIKLQTKKGTAHWFKTDIFKKTIWYIYSGEAASGPIALSVSRARQIIELNAKNIFPEDLVDSGTLAKVEKKIDYENVVGQDSINRFDDKKKKQHHGKQHHKQHHNKVNQNNKGSRQGSSQGNQNTNRNANQHRNSQHNNPHTQPKPNTNKPNNLQPPKQ